MTLVDLLSLCQSIDPSSYSRHTPSYYLTPAPLLSPWQAGAVSSISDGFERTRASMSGLPHHCSGVEWQIPSPLLSAILCALLFLSAFSCSLVPVEGALRPSPSPVGPSLRPRDVRIEGFRSDTEKDLVVDATQPSFTWQLEGERNAEGHLLSGIHQIHYDLHLSDTPSPVDPLKGWDYLQSLGSNRTTHVRYTGPPLRADHRYHWRLRYESSSGAVSDWATGTFRTGLLLPQSTFDGVWIGSRAIHMNQLRREFLVPASVQSATVFLSGVGLYEFYVNGVHIDSTRRLDPAWTEYGLRTLYVSYDVTEQLQAGKMNCMGVLLGNGWYAPEQWGIWSPVMVGHPEYGPARLLLQLNLHLSNGSVVVSGQ